MQSTAAHDITTRADLDANIAKMNRHTDPQERAERLAFTAFVRDMLRRPEIVALSDADSDQTITRAWQQRQEDQQ